MLLRAGHGLTREDPPGAHARLTRREFLVRSGSAAGGLVAVGLLGSAAAAVPRFPGAEDIDADVATAWFDLALELVRATPGSSPPVASRAFAYAGLALYEALVPGIRDARSLAEISSGLPPVPAAGRNAAYDWAVVANAALGEVLRSLFPTAPPELRSAIEALEASEETRTGTGLAPGVIRRSAERGRAVAGAVFDWSISDGGHEGYLRNFPPYDPPVGPGLWEPTPPGFLPALQPTWGSNRCFVLPAGSACPCGAHAAFSEEEGSAFHTEAIEVYEVVNAPTAEQEAIARFWSDDPGSTPTPPGHSISIATQVLRREDASLALAAETYARVGMAVADAFIACWHQKYTYNLLRPVTYLRRLLDPEWLPPLVTPPFPEYPSGHSVQSGAASQVLTDTFGDAYAFADRTHDERGLSPRAFGSFLEAAEEAAISRLYGGIHFRAAIENGLTQGLCIGQAVSALPLRG